MQAEKNFSRREFLKATASVSLAGLTQSSAISSAFASSGVTAKEQRAIDRIVQDFRNSYGVPGLSLCVARKGDMVFSQGFGLADQSTDEPVRSDHLFRIASLSKPLTSVGIYSLLEAGKLKLQDKVFGDGAILSNLADAGGDVTKITVDHLLTHTSGGWPNDGYDPMFTNPDDDARSLIRYTVGNSPLSATPGAQYAYSNFGYCVLGRVIEQLTGLSYADHIKVSVLHACGATSMQIAGNTFFDRKSDEVRYYGQDGEDPYSMNVERMDSHGGWLASSPDLVKFLLHVDRYKSVADILSAASTKSMSTASKANPNYARGWSVNQYGNWWHSGSLPGTTSVMVRTSHGFCWTALANSRKPDSDIDLALDQLMWKVVETPRAWRG